MASHPPRQCCAIGVKHEGEPTGSSLTIGDGIDAYFAKASGKNVHEGKVILYLPDVISIWQNSQLMADQFAANGYSTLIVDTFNKDPVKMNGPADFDFMKWLSEGTGGGPHTYKQVDPIVETAIKYLKDQGFNEIGAVGYCFGAKYVARFMASGKGIKVGYVAHPSFVEEDELRAITGPFSISAAETDQIFPEEKRHASEKILKEVGQPYQLNLFSGVSHGFAVRCDTSKKIEKFSKEQAFLQAVAWFDEYLA